jgi:hypothetical protein
MKKFGKQLSGLGKVLLLAVALVFPLQVAGQTSPVVRMSDITPEAWDNGTDYGLNARVTHEGSYWAATADPTTGDEPGVDADWLLLATDDSNLGTAAAADVTDGGQASNTVPPGDDARLNAWPTAENTNIAALTADATLIDADLGDVLGRPYQYLTPDQAGWDVNVQNITTQRVIYNADDTFSFLLSLSGTPITGGEVPPLSRALVFYDGSQVVAQVQRPEHFAIAFDPKAVCDGAVDRLFLMTVGAHAPNGLKVAAWSVSFEADPTTEVDLDLKRADAFIGVANAAVMDVLDTTTGAAAETVGANINSGATVAATNVLYLEHGTAYTETTHQIIFQMWYFQQ